jgi:mono/diheme cytochrome c family protein
MMTAFRIALGLSLLLSGGARPAADPGDGWEIPSEARTLRNPIPDSGHSRRKGAQLFLKHCTVCHGEDGRGNGPAARDLKTRPADLTDRREMARMTEGEIFWKIAHGRDPMPPFRRLMRDEEIWHLTRYVREIVRAGGAPAAPEAPHSLSWFPASADDCP